MADKWDEIIKLDGGWSVRHNEGSYWYVCAPNGHPVRTPAFLEKEGAIKGYPQERELYEWECGVEQLAFR